MGQTLSQNFQCCSAADGDEPSVSFRPGGSFLPPRESNDKKKNFRSPTPSGTSSQVGGAEVESLSGTSKLDKEMSPEAYNELLKKISVYDDEFTRMKESLGSLQAEVDSLQDKETTGTGSAGGMGVPKLSVGSSDCPKADTISSESPSVGRKSESSKLTQTPPAVERYVPVETPEIRKGKFHVYKAGPRDIGRIDSWKPAKYDVKIEEGSFLKERVSKKINEKPPKYGKFHVYKAGPRDIGRVKGWKPANYGIDLKALSQENFLKERTSSSKPLYKNGRRDVNADKNSKKVARNQKKSYSSDYIDTRVKKDASTNRKRKSNSSQKSFGSRKSSARSTKSDKSLEAYSTTPVTIPRRKTAPPSLPPRPTSGEDVNGTYDPDAIVASPPPATVPLFFSDIYAGDGSSI